MYNNPQGGGEGTQPPLLISKFQNALPRYGGVLILKPTWLSQTSRETLHCLPSSRTVITFSKGFAVFPILSFIISNFQTFPETCEFKADRESNQLEQIHPSHEGEFPGKTEPHTSMSGVRYGRFGTTLGEPPRPRVAPDNTNVSPKLFEAFLALLHSVPSAIHSFTLQTCVMNIVIG